MFFFVKLAFCLFKYFPFGGLQRDFLRIAKECIKRGHQVDVYAMAWEGEREPGLRVQLFPAKGWQNHARAAHFVRDIAPHLVGYDLVVGFNKMPGLDVYYAADTCYQAKARLQRGWWYRLSARYKHLVDAERAVFAHTKQVNILLLSSKQQADFMRYYQTQAERFYLLPPGITKDRVAGADAEDVRHRVRKTWSIEDDAFLLLMVGSGFKTKGLDRVLKGFAHLPSALKQRCYLYVIGKDNPERFLKQAKTYGLLERIRFLGGRHDVPDFLLAADLLLHPAYNENTGTVLLEAIASGLPVLTTEVCGYAAHIEQAKAGIVLPSPYDQAAFDDALASMLLSSERQTLRQNAKVYAEKADIYRLPEHAADLIESFSAKGKL